jgi:hypothetical protein
MEATSSVPEVGASPDMISQKDADSEVLYDLGIILIYGGGVGLVVYFLFI